MTITMTTTLLFSLLLTMANAAALVARQDPSQIIIKQFISLPPGTVVISNNTTLIGFQFDASSDDGCFFSNPDPTQFISDSDRNLVQYRIVFSTAQFDQAVQQNLQVGGKANFGSGSSGPNFNILVTPPGFDSNIPFTQITIASDRQTGKASDRKLVDVGVQIQNSAGTTSICSGQFKVGQAGVGDSTKDCSGETTLNPMFIDLASSCGQTLTAPGLSAGAVSGLSGVAAPNSVPVVTATVLAAAAPVQTVFVTAPAAA